MDKYEETRSGWAYEIIFPRCGSDPVSVIAHCPACGCYNAISHKDAMGYYKGTPVVWCGFVTNWYLHKEEAEAFARSNAEQRPTYKFCPECGRCMVDNETTAIPEPIDAGGLFHPTEAKYRDVDLYAVRISALDCIAQKSPEIMRGRMWEEFENGWYFKPYTKTGKASTHVIMTSALKIFTSEDDARLYVHAKELECAHAIIDRSTKEYNDFATRKDQHEN